MQTPPRVSIIVPAYNAQKTIARCLSSICSQTWKDMEIIVLNDGSQDNTLAVCKELAAKDDRIIVVDKPNSGVADTRNRGLEMARGKYIQFVDSDDLILPEYTERMVDAAEKSDADFVISAYWLVFPADFEEHPRWWEKAVQLFVKRNPPKTKSFGFLDDGVYSQAEYARAVMRHPYAFYHAALWNKLYRRETLMKSGIRFKIMKFSEDFTFNTELLPQIQKVAAVSYAGYGYVQNSQSLCHSSISNLELLESHFPIFRDYKTAYQKMGLYSEQRRRIWMSFFAENEFTLESELPQLPVPEIIVKLFG